MAKKDKDNNYFGLASVILGILSIVFGITVIFGSVGGLVLGVISLVFSIMQKKRHKNSWSKAGLILSIIGIGVNIFFLVFLVKTLAEVAQQIQLAAESGALPA